MSVNPKAERIPDPVYPPEESEEPTTPEVKKPQKKTEIIVTPQITLEQKTPEKLPQTGQLRWPILALSAVGAVLLFLGWWIGRKKKRLFQGSDGAWDPSGSRSSGDLRV